MPEDDHLTEYERAICYYTLPKLSNPVTFGLIVAYAVCLFEAAGVLLVGIVRGDRMWFLAGLIALAAIVVFGVVVFVIRAFLTELRQRKALAQAHGVPDHSDSFKDFDLPDPFEEHILLRYTASRKERIDRCMDGEITLAYTVECAPDRDWWLLKNPDGTEACRVRTLEGVLPFTFNSGRPRKLGVYTEEKEIAVISRPFSFALPFVEIRHSDGDAPLYLVKNSSIYMNNVLVGRLYELRGRFYLDVQSRHFQPAIIAYFATLT